MKRTAEKKRDTKETQIAIKINLDGEGNIDVTTGIPFFDHMLTLFAAHGAFDLAIKAEGDLEVDFHHTVEDVGIVLGDVVSAALGDRKGIRRFGNAVTPMDESLADVAIDLSNRPYLAYNVPVISSGGSPMDADLAKEFFRAFATHGGMNLHINLRYGENGHHVLEAVFKACGRALRAAVEVDGRFSGVRSTKGTL